MKRNYKHILSCIGLVLAGWGMSSCSKMDDTYKDFLEGGEIVYVQGADSLKVHPGYKRIKLSWIALSDPTVTRAMVYWDNGQDSLEVPITKTENIDTVNVWINDLEERIYTFEIYTFDAQGRTSVPTLGIGESYGDVYKNSLLTRLLRTALFRNDSLEIIWGSVDRTAIAVELDYVDTLGNPRLAYVPVEQTGPDTTLTFDYDHAAEGKFRYRTVYLPDTLSVDTFYTGFTEVKVYGPPTPYDNAGWVATASSFDGRNDRTDRLPQVALDNDNNSIWVNQISPQLEYPHWIAVDMGEVKTETAGIWLGLPGSRADTPGLIEVSVSDDGVEWTVVTSFTVKSQAGVQYFEFPEALDFRHFKINCLEASGDNKNVVIGEVGAYSR